MATEAAVNASRFTAVHSDGYGLAFANLYRDFANGDEPHPFLSQVPGIEDGRHTLAVVEAAMQSQQAGLDWMEVSVVRHDTYLAATRDDAPRLGS